MSRYNGFDYRCGDNEEYDEQWDDYESQSDGIEYLVFPEKGVIVCKIWGCAHIAWKRIWKYTGNCAGFEFMIPDIFTGVAKCAPEDKFDEEYGKKLALAKAKAKRGKAINNAVSQYINKEMKVLDVLRQYGIHEIPDPKQI